MGLFTLNDYKSDEWKVETERLNVECNRAAGDYMAAEKRRDDLYHFLHSQQQHSDSFEYKKMQFELKQLEDEVARKRSISDNLDYQRSEHCKSWG